MKQAAAWLLRLALAGVFLYAGAVKAIDPASFARDVAGYRLLPQALNAGVALYLPWLEIACGVALLIPAWTRAAAATLFVLTLAFAAALGSAWLRGLDITCGCFGTADRGGYAWWLIRDAAIGVAILALLALSTRDINAHCEPVGQSSCGQP